MHLFLCGKGQAAELILTSLVKERRWERKLAVYTHPGSPLVEMAAAYLLPCYTSSVNDMGAWPFTPGIIASVGYLNIIKPHVLAAVPRVFNCHYALLPNHRGRSAVPWAIVDGDTYSGITYHWIDEGIDTGRILFQAVAQIEPRETQASLFDKLHRLAVAYWPTALHLAWSGFPGVPQVGRAKHHKAGPPCGGVIDPAWTEDTIDRFIRAMTYPPLGYATYGGQEVRSLDQWREIVTGNGAYYV